MKPVIRIFGESFLYSCAFDKSYTYEKFVPEHVLAYQISGQTQIYHQRGKMLLEEGQFLLARRNQTSFKREFSDIFKTSPGTWLKAKRLSEAYYLIKKKNQKPQDIYLGLGFENLSHFYTAFKAKYGVTPAGINPKNK